MKLAGELRLSAFGLDPLLGTYNPHASEPGVGGHHREVKCNGCTP